MLCWRRPIYEMNIQKRRLCMSRWTFSLSLKKSCFLVSDTLFYFLTKWMTKVNSDRGQGKIKEHGIFDIGTICIAPPLHNYCLLCQRAALLEQSEGLWHNYCLLCQRAALLEQSEGLWHDYCLLCQRAALLEQSEGL